MAASQKEFNQQLKKYYSFYTGGFVIFVVLLAIGEKMGMPNKWIGYCFLVFTILLYAGIGIMSRTLEVAEYYVAGRRVPAFFNGMATGADWMSAASFIGMAGTLYLSGFDGLAFIMGWTGGYVLVALLLAPYLRKFGQFTIPDFLGARYGGNIVRSLGVIAAIIASFTYVVAQIYGVGLITSRFTGLEFGIGVFVGLAGILVCSFLGGMKAVTWTQVAQYVILIIAYMIPVVWLSVKHTGIPLPQLVYGTVLEKVTEREKVLTNDPGEKAVRQIFADRAKAADEKIKALPASYQVEKDAVAKKLEDLKAASAPKGEIDAAEKALKDFPASPEAAKAKWTADKAGAAGRTAPPKPHATPYPGKDEAARNNAKWNFIGIVFCMMFGTAALPHILMRYYTTPSVHEARVSVFWSLFFIFLLYFTAPALAVLAKYDVYTLIVGSKFADLPAWVNAWRTVDPGLLNITDINKDGIVQLAEIVIGGDLIVLATPEIAGLPYVISGLVAAGGLAAALSTADGLLLTIANALSHDLYYKMINPNASPGMRITVSKILLLGVAVIAAYVTSLKPGNILFLVGAAFSIAASAFFPALVMGIFWKRASKIGAIAGIVAGLGTCLYYMVHTYPVFIQWFGTTPIQKWFGLEPISAGMFGVPIGLVTIFVVSLVTPAPDKEVQELVDHVRYPNLVGDIDTKGT
ncbi:MAG: cation acetate symporter [Betaproteobacteria bacterium]|nr:MAG: cation acetate symporter [Betaproteobacteria bacterium]